MYRVYRNRTVKSDEYRNWLAECYYLMRTQEPRLKPMLGEVRVMISAMPKDGRLRDVDNYIKAILDLMEFSNVLTNDRQVKVVTCFRYEPSGGKHQVQVDVSEWRDDPEGITADPQERADDTQ